MGQAIRDVDVPDGARPGVFGARRDPPCLPIRHLRKFFYCASIYFAMVQFLSNDFRM